MNGSMTRMLGDSGTLDQDAPVALVTGAAGALGAAIVTRLARAGVTIVGVDLDGKQVSRVLEKAGAGGSAIEADLSRPEAGSEIVALAGDRFGRIDHVVNNAGLNRFESLDAIASDNWDAVLAVNLRAPMLLCQAVIPFWKTQGGGSIVNIGSRVWLSGTTPAYTASKAGIVGLTRSFAVELGRWGVRANAVAPSFIDTAFTRQNRTEEQIETLHRRVIDITPLPRVGKAEDIANAVAFLISDDASFITGEILHVCGGAQLAPQLQPFHTDMHG